jgi:hypothetical protein
MRLKEMGTILLLNTGEIPETGWGEDVGIGVWIVMRVPFPSFC